MKFISKDIFDEIAQLGTHAERVYRAAIEYSRQGILVVPLDPNTKILPAKASGINYSTATSKEETIKKWFNPQTGRYIGYNIGIACGKAGGVFVVDVDVKGGKNGFAELAVLQEEHGVLPPCPVALTPSGGMHYFFNWFENGACTTGKLAKSIDTRGGDIDMPRGHVVAFPSMVDGKMYTWDKGGVVPDIPAWVANLMGVSWKAKAATAGGRGNEYVGEDDVEDKIPLEQIVRMLKAIDIEKVDYMDWLAIGQAINTQYPDQDGLAVWGAWSKTGSRFKPGECTSRWEGFNPAGPVRMGTLFFHAKNHGWVPEEKDALAAGKWGEVIAKMNAKHAVVWMGDKMKVYWDLGKDRLPAFRGVEDTRTYYSNETYPSVNAQGRPVMRSVMDIWMSSDARREYIGTCFRPGVETTEEFNMWRGFCVDPEPGDVEPFLAHVRDVICSGKEEEIEWLLDWFAHMVQSPGEKPGTAIVMGGGEGIGKGSLVLPFESILKNYYSHITDTSHVVNRFNRYMEQGLLLFIDEATWGGYKKEIGKLKGLITEKKLIIERKGVDTETKDNFTRVIIASNDEWVIPAGSDSRRFFMPTLNGSKAGDMEYFRAYREWIRRGGDRALLHWLLEREITNDIFKAPVTRRLKDQRLITTSHDPVQEWLMNVCVHGMFKTRDVRFDPNDGHESWPETVSKGDLYKEFEEWCEASRSFRVALEPWATKMHKPYGFRKTRSSVGGHRIYTFRVPSLDALRESVAKVAGSASYDDMVEAEDEVLDSDVD